MKMDNRVVITKSVIGLTGMQVCAVKDATDAEILEHVNKKNPSGTENGWSKIINTSDDLRELKMGENCLPVQCSDDCERVHKLVIC